MTPSKTRELIARGFAIVASVCLVLSVFGLDKAEAICDENPVFNGTVFFSVPGQTSCPGMSSHKNCDTLASAMTYAMLASNENVTRVAMCSNATIGTNTTLDQAGIPARLAHFWLSKVGSELYCYNPSQGCVVTVEAVAKASVFLISVDNTAIHNVSIRRTHAPIASVVHNFTEVSNVLVYSVVQGAGDYISELMGLDDDSGASSLALRDISREEYGRKHPSQARDAILAEKSRLVEDSVALDIASRKALRMEHLESIESLEAVGGVSSGLYAQKGLERARDADVANRAAGSRVLRTRGSETKGRMSARNVSPDVIPTPYLKPCAVNTTGTSCTVFGLVLTGMDFRQSTSVGPLVNADILIDNGTYADFFVNHNRFGYFENEIDNCTQASSLVRFPGIWIYGTVPSFFNISLDDNDFVYATLDVVSGSASTSPVVFGGLSALRCYFVPRPFESSSEFQTPLVNHRLFPGKCDTNPYRLFPLGHVGKMLYGPMYVDRSDGTALGFCLPEQAMLWAQGHGLRAVKIQFTSQIYTMNDTLVVDFPTEFCSHQIPEIHGIRYPVLQFNPANACVPSVISVSQAFSISNLNVKLAQGARGILYWDTDRTNANVDRFNGPCTNTTHLHTLLNDIRSFVGSASSFSTLAARDLKYVRTLASDNVVFQGGVWAILLMADRPTLNVTLQQNNFVGQIEYGVTAVSTSGLIVEDNVFNYIHLIDSFRWSLGSNAADPAHLSGQVPNSGVLPTDGSQGGLVIYDSVGVEIKGNHFWKCADHGLLVYGRTMNPTNIHVKCNVFMANHKSGIHAGCYSDNGTAPPNPVVHCANINPLFTTVRAWVVANHAGEIPASSCVDFLELWETTPEADWNNSTFIIALADYLIAQSGGLPNGAYVNAHASAIAISTFDTVLGACSENVNSQGIDYSVQDVLNPALPCGANTLGLFQQTLFQNGACDGSTIVTGPGGSSSPIIGACGMPLSGFVVESNSYSLDTLLSFEGVVNPVQTVRDNSLQLSLAPSTPYKLLIDLPIGQDAVVNSGVLSLRSGSGDVFQSTAFLPHVEDALGSCTNPNLVEWRSYVYYEKLGYQGVCVVIPESTSLSEVTTVSSDAKLVKSTVGGNINYTIAESILAAKTGLSPSEELCRDMDIASRDVWLLTGGSSCRNISGIPLCENWQGFDYDAVTSFNSSCLPEYTFPGERFVTQWVLATPPTINITALVNCNNGTVFNGMNDTENHVYVVSNFNRTLEILNALPPLLTFNANVTIAYFGNCHECIVFSNVSYHITVKPFDKSGTRSFLIHPLACPNHVVVEYSSNIRFLRTDFRSDLPIESDEAFSLPADLDPTGLVAPVTLPPPVGMSERLPPRSLSALRRPAKRDSIVGYRNSWDGRKSRFEKRDPIVRPPLETLVPLTSGTDRFLGCQEVPFGEIEDHYLRSVYIDASSNIHFDRATFAAYERVEAVGMIFSVNVSFTESVFVQQVTGVSVYSEVSRYNATVGLHSTVKLGRRGIKQLIDIWSRDRIHIDNSTFALGQNGISVRMCKAQDNLVNPDFYLVATNNTFVGNEGVSFGITGIAYVPQMMGGSLRNAFWGLTDNPSEAPRIADQSGLSSLKLDYPITGSPGSFVTKHVLNSLDELLADNKGSYNQNQGMSFNGGYLISSDDSFWTAFYNSFQVGGGGIVNGTFADGSKTTFDSSDHALQPYQHSFVLNSTFSPNAIVQITTHAFNFITQFNNTVLNPETFFTKAYDLCKQTLTDVSFDNVRDVRDDTVLVEKPPPGGFSNLNDYIDPGNRKVVQCPPHYEYVALRQGCGCVDIGGAYYVSTTTIPDPSSPTGTSFRQEKLACKDLTLSVTQDGRTKCVDVREKHDHRTKLREPPFGIWIGLGLLLLGIIVWIVVQSVAAIRVRAKPSRTVVTHA